MDLRLWTTPDEVRALLGINEADISDATILLPVYSVGLEAEARDVSPRLPSEFKRVAALVTLTEDEAWFLRVARSFAAYAVARMVLTALPLAAMRDSSDGKASEARFASAPYHDTMKMLESSFNVAKGRVLPALSQVTVSAPPRSQWLSQRPS